MEIIDFQGKKWHVIGKADGGRVDDPASLRSNYGCDMVIRNPQNIYFMLNKIIDVEYEDM